MKTKEEVLMYQSINEIRKKNIKIIDKIEYIIHNLRNQNFDLSLRTVTIVINELSVLIDLLIAEANYFNEESMVIDNNVVIIVENLLNAQENKDYVLLADLYELQLKPLLLKIQQIIVKKQGWQLDDHLYLSNMDRISDQISIDLKYKSIEEMLVNIDSGYVIEYTSSGQMTLAIENENKKFYFHSNHLVSNEALNLANYWYNRDKNNYIIYGLGLGYHIKALSNIDKNISIEVFESDINIIHLACAFSDIGDLFTEKNIKLNYDPSFKNLISKVSLIKDEDEFLIHYPSLRNIKNTSVKQYMENYFIQHSSIHNQLSLLYGNFRNNIKNYDSTIDDLKKEFIGRDIYIVAAGPSLDKNFLLLKKLGNKGIILATGTVFRKLLNEGIRPDYVIVTDANERVYGQIKGLENEYIPMLYLSTAYKGFASNYKGKKYIILQHDFNKSEEYAKRYNLELIKTGGSVSTTALDIGISLGCNRIIFLGLDLAYTDNYVHALGTSRRELASTEDLRQVKDIHGNLIYTSKSLDMYRSWIENRINEVENIIFLNATEGGADIKGMKNIKLSEIIKDINR